MDAPPEKGTSAAAEEVFLWELYRASHADVTCRATVPVLIDVTAGAILNCESADIVRALDDAARRRAEARDARIVFRTLRPAAHAAALDEVNALIYAGLNNGVYKCGFAGDPAAFSSAHAALLETLQARGRSDFSGHPCRNAVLFCSRPAEKTARV
jgi:putative glutathione S-transferase